ncbi:MAG: hypothetical protein FWD46_04350 [Cystobacterineae bacterium]|nr:hypothetical protein [Cystobacterineae bacterium]
MRNQLLKLTCHRIKAGILESLGQISYAIETLSQHFVQAKTAQHAKRVSHTHG